MSADDKTLAVQSLLVKPPNSQAYPELYAARKKIHPKRVKGKYRTLKWLVMLVTLGIYYITPWIRWDRGPYAPDQAVLIDLENARFYFFLIEIWPQEFFFLAGLLIMAGIGLFLLTSIIGRAWCGYTCPQTVWVDLFLLIEHVVEGDRGARIKLDAMPMSWNKAAKRLCKHFMWLLIAVLTGGAWVFYFADAPTLLSNLLSGEAQFEAYATILLLTATTYSFGGLLREQVCIYMCPWPRVQAAMLDEHSLTVTYNDWRGEPRTKHVKRARSEGKVVGDCVDCNACVSVCPMGIDIRNGQQLECITCALCIDACDSVMKKLNLESGLISYTTLGGYNKNMLTAGAQQIKADGDIVWDTTSIKSHKVRTESGLLSGSFVKNNLNSFIRPRTCIYLALWSLCGLALLVALLTRDRLDLSVSHDRNPLYVTLSDGAIRNGYKIKILNMRVEPRTFELSIIGLKDYQIAVSGTPQSQTKKLTVPVKSDQLRQMQIFVRVPKRKLITSRQKFQFVVRDVNSPETVTYDAYFESPES